MYWILALVIGALTVPLAMKAKHGIRLAKASELEKIEREMDALIASKGKIVDEIIELSEKRLRELQDEVHGLRDTMMRQAARIRLLEDELIKRQIPIPLC